MVVRAPLAGTACPLSDVPDPVFSAGMLGGGIAIIPEIVDDEPHPVVSPVAGTVLKARPHAVMIQTPDEHVVLVHLGIDTHRLADKAFQLVVADGDDVNEGSLLLSWKPALCVSYGLAAHAAIIAMENPGVDVLVEGGAALSPGDELFAFN